MTYTLGPVAPKSRPKRLQGSKPVQTRVDGETYDWLAAQGVSVSSTLRDMIVRARCEADEALRALEKEQSIPLDQLVSVLEDEYSTPWYIGHNLAKCGYDMATVRGGAKVTGFAEHHPERATAVARIFAEAERMFRVLPSGLDVAQKGGTP